LPAFFLGAAGRFEFYENEFRPKMKEPKTSALVFLIRVKSFGEVRSELLRAFALKSFFICRIFPL